MSLKYIYYHKIKKHKKINPLKLEDLQNKKLKHIISHAYNNIPFYRKKFKKKGITPNDIKDTSDINKLPYITKSEIQSNKEDIIDKNIDKLKCRITTTSGSTGKPLTIYIDRNSAAINDATWIRTYLENGLHLADKIAYIRTPRNFPKKKPLLERIGLLKRKYISIEGNPKTQMSLLEEFNPNIIRSYSSALTTIATEFKDNNNSVYPRKIFTSAELVDKESRNLINSYFNSELYDNYSCNEVALIAWECREHEGYHINADNMLVEFIKDDNHVSSGERGEIVLTTLNNLAMPLIRYRIGDVGIPSQETCPCGITLPLMSVVEGRKDDLLYTVDGVPVSPHLIKGYLKKIFGNMDIIKQFRVIQEKEDRLVLQISLESDVFVQQSVYDKADKVIREVFGVGMGYELKFIDRIERESSGKIRTCISLLRT